MVNNGAKTRSATCKQRADAGMCTRCGESPPVSTSRLCFDCLEKHRIGHHCGKQIEGEGHLCNTCKFATAVHCDWFGRDDATGITVKKKTFSGEIYIGYYVYDCKKYKEGELMPI